MNYIPQESLVFIFSSYFPFIIKNIEKETRQWYCINVILRQTRCYGKKGKNNFLIVCLLHFSLSPQRRGILWFVTSSKLSRILQHLFVYNCNLSVTATIAWHFSCQYFLVWWSTYIIILMMYQTQYIYESLTEITIDI